MPVSKQEIKQVSAAWGAVLGIGSALIQNKDAAREEFDSAWTGAQEVAYIKVATAALGLVLFGALVLHYVAALRLSDFFMHTWRPILSVAIMVIVLAVFPRTDSLALLLK